MHVKFGASYSAEEHTIWLHW